MIFDTKQYDDIRDGVRAVCAQFPDEYHRKVDHERGYPEEFVQALTREGWMAALIPEAYGGSGLSLTAASVIMEEINRLPISELRSYVAPQVEAPGVYHSVSVAFILPGSDEGAVSLPLPENYTGGIPNPVEVQVTLQWQDDRGRAYQVQQSTMRGE